MPIRTRAERRADDLRATTVVATHLDWLLDIAVASHAEIGPGQANLTVCQQDARMAADIAARLDDALTLPEPWETLDGPVLFLVALAVVGIWRATSKGKNRPLARTIAGRNREGAEARAAR
jgi:hypothetical protein